MRQWSIVGAFAASAALTACAPPPDYLYVDPHAQPVRVELRRSFGIMQKHYGPVPITDCGFYVKAETGDASSVYRQEIWRVMTTIPDEGSLALVYGVVPPGFVQATPPAGLTPPALEPEKTYTVECNGDAIGTAQFQLPSLTTRTEPPLRKREP
jgi:hypothetical protein